MDYNKDKIPVKDPNSDKIISITRDEYNTGNYEGMHKNTVMARFANEKKSFRTTKDDPRFETGEIVTRDFGKLIIYNYRLNKRKLIFPDELHNYINDGWRIGGPNSSKKVLQYDLEGNFIQEFDSVKVAFEITRAPRITASCSCKQVSSGGFIWKYKNE